MINEQCKVVPPLPDDPIEEEPRLERDMSDNLCGAFCTACIEILGKIRKNGASIWNTEWMR